MSSSENKVRSKDLRRKMWLRRRSTAVMLCSRRSAKVLADNRSSILHFGTAAIGNTVRNRAGAQC